MRLSLYMPRALAVFCTAVCLSSCGTGTDFMAGGFPQFALTTPAASDWQAAELNASIEQSTGGWVLTLSSQARLPAQTLLAEIKFDQRLTAVQIERLVELPELSLLVSDRPGYLALGLIMPIGDTLDPGMLLRAKLTPSASRLRAASKLPAQDAAYVSDLSGSEDAVGGFTLHWGYYNNGDYDQNSEANIADLTPLAGRLLKSTTDGDRDGLDAVLDGDSNGEVNVGDITPLGANFLGSVSGYHVYRADGPDVATANSVLIADVAFESASAEPDTRRQYAQQVPAGELLAQAYYYVRPYDTASGGEGPASNVLQYVPTVLLKFYLPPGGDFVVDGGQCQNPSLVLMPAIPGISQAGAPVVVYTTLGGEGISPLKLGYYGQSGWTTEDIGAGGDYSFPQALWLPGSEGNPGTGAVIVYNIEGLKVVELSFNEAWEHVATTDVATGDGTPARLALDRDPLTGQLGLAQSYNDLGSGTVQFSYRDAGGIWTTEPVADVTDTLAGLDFRYDPTGGEPWLFYTHGTLLTTPTISLNYTLEQVRRSGGSWQMSTIAHPDSPQQLELGFSSDGTPQLVFTSARDYTINIPTQDPITISLLFDVVTADYTGSSWNFDQSFESTFGISLDGFPPTALILELNLASDTGWARPDEFLFTQSEGSIAIDIVSYIPQDGAIDSSSVFMRRQGGGSYSETGYYGGAAGRSYSWAVAASDDPVCAYVRSSAISAQDILNGDFALAGELAFWSP